MGQNLMLMPLEADWRNQGFRPNKEASRGESDGLGHGHGRDGYSETETMQILSRTHLQSASSNSNEMQRHVYFRRAGETQMQHNFTPHISPPNYQVQYPSSSGNGGRIGGDLSLTINDQQWQSAPPQLFAAAAASSGFSPQIKSSQHWLQKNGFHTLMRPS
ncbi:hypothetical protein CFP56_031402 [Quercus suber]|uniref:Lanceolate n=3 Tax=Quercus suber TaxID=58331 RepID=A0AAW0JJY6_QUESU